MKNIHIIISFLLLLPVKVFCQQNTDKYNFDFERPLKGSSWICILDDFKVKMDSMNKSTGKYSLLMTRTFLKKEFNLNINQPILLPQKIKEIKASIFAESKQLASAELKITGFDRTRSNSVSDSISIISDGSWKNFTAAITSDQGFEILTIEIKAKEEFKIKKNWVNLWVDNLQIILDGTNLYDYKNNDKSFSKEEYDDVNNCIELTPSLTIPQNTNEKNNSKIVGFGESVHGSKEINRSVFNNIITLIQNQNCRLVLLEVPIDLGIRLNQYINEENFDEDLKELISGYLIDYAEFSSFLNWLKQYNLKTDDKVYLFGFDNYAGYVPRNINNFILSQKNHSDEIDSLLSLINSHKYRSIPLRYAENHFNELQSLYGKKQASAIIQYLKNRTDSLCRIVTWRKSQDWHGVTRDYLMWQNVKFAIENLREKTSKIAIYSHLSHLDKKNPVFLNSVKSLGQYLNEYYGENYDLTGMFIGEGTISTFNDSNIPISQRINSPNNASIEYVCTLSGKDRFYKTLPVLSTIPLLNRRVGTYYCESREFTPSFIKGSMDAIIFIRESTAGLILPQSRKYNLYKKK